MDEIHEVLGVLEYSAQRRGELAGRIDALVSEVMELNERSKTARQVLLRRLGVQEEKMSEEAVTSESVGLRQRDAAAQQLMAARLAQGQAVASHGPGGQGPGAQEQLEREQRAAVAAREAAKFGAPYPGDSKTVRTGWGSVG